MAIMSESHTVFIETILETRLALLLHKDDHVSAFKGKFCKEHAQCFPNFGEITASALKVNWQDRYYHLSDSMILSKAFEDISSQRFVFVDVASVEEKRDPTHEEALQIQAAEETTKKRKLKTSWSAKKSRKKIALVPNESKDIENVISLGENQNVITCDVNQDGLVKDVNVNQTLEGNIDLDLIEAIEQDIEMGETNVAAAAAAADIVMIDQENDLEKGAANNLLPTAELYVTTDAEDEGFIDGVDTTSESLPNSGGEKVTNTLEEVTQNDNDKVDNGEKDGDVAKPVKPKQNTKSRKDKIVPKEDTLVDSTVPNAVLALSAPNVEHGDGEKIVKKASKRLKKKQSENVVE